MVGILVYVWSLGELMFYLIFMYFSSPQILPKFSEILMYSNILRHS